MVYHTEAELQQFAQIDPELEELLKASPQPDVDYSDLDTFKEAVLEQQKVIPSLLGDAPAGVKESETYYTTRDGVQMRAILYQPSTPPSNGSPMIVMFHAGGWCVGLPELETIVCRNLVQAFGAVCVSCSYRLAPEFKFPTGVLDAWDALRWAAENSKSFGADPAAGFILSGTSAGGNLAAVLSHKARDEGLQPPLTGTYHAIPAVGGSDPSVFPEEYRARAISCSQCKFAPVMPKAGYDMLLKGYAPDQENHELYSVFAHPKGHTGLPPSAFQLCGMDPLRDEGLIYANMLEKAGVKTTVKVMAGLPHDYWTFMPQLKASLLFRKDQVNSFGWLLGREPQVARVTMFG